MRRGWAAGAILAALAGACRSPPGGTLTGAATGTGDDEGHVPTPAELARRRPVRALPIDPYTLELTFANGFRFVPRHVPGERLVALVLRVHAGSADDPPGKEGLAHLVEHLTFLSPIGRGGRLGEMLQNRGALSNAFTTHDATYFVTIAPAGDLARLELPHFEASRLAAPVHHIDDAAWQNEVQVVENELRERREGHGAGPLAAIYAGVFPADHPYARPVGGTPESLRRIRREDVLEFTRRHYRPGNATLVVLGDLRRDAISRMVRLALWPALDKVSLDGALDRAVTPATPGAASSPRGEAALARTRAPQPSPALYVSWPLPAGRGSQRHQNAVAAKLVEGLLGKALDGDDDVLGASCHTTDDLLAAILMCEVRLVDGTHPERTRERILAALATLPPKAIATLLVIAHGAEQHVRAGSISARALSLSWAIQAGEAKDGDTLPDTDVLVSDALGVVEKHVTIKNARTLLVEPAADAGLAAAPPGQARSTFEDEETALASPKDLDRDHLWRLLPASPAARLFDKRLPNGLRVIIGGAGQYPVASVGLVVPGPPTPSIVSMAALDASRPRQLAPADLVLRHLGGSHASGGTTVWTYDVGSGDLEPALACLRAALDREVAPASLAHQRTTVARFAQRVLRQPEVEIDRRLVRMLHGSSLPSAEEVVQRLERLGERDVQAWLDQHLRPENATLVVVGEVDPQQALALVHRYFLGWKGQGSVVAPPTPGRAPQPRRATASVAVVPTPGTQVQIDLGCSLAGPLAAMTAAQELLATYLRIRLGSAVRGGLGATYGVQAWLEAPHPSAPLLRISTRVEPTKLAAVLSRIDALLQGGDAIDDRILMGLLWQGVRQYPIRYAGAAAVAARILGLAANGSEPISVLAKEPRDLVQTKRDDLRALLATCAAAPATVLAGDPEQIRRALAESRYPAPR